MRGIKDSKLLKEIALEVLEGLEVEYFTIVNHALQEMEQIQKDSTLILVAARVEGVRLLDNLWF